MFHSTILYAKWGASLAFVHVNWVCQIFFVHIPFVLKRRTLQGNTITKKNAHKYKSNGIFFRCPLMQKRKTEFDEYVKLTCHEQEVEKLTSLDAEKILLPHSALPANVARMAK